MLLVLLVLLVFVFVLEKKVFRWSIEVGKPASLERLQAYVRKHPDVVHARYVGLITTIPKRFFFFFLVFVVGCVVVGYSTNQKYRHR